MIFDVEVVVDQVRHPPARPQRCFVTQGLWSSMQQFHQAGFVGRIQTGQPSRSAGPPQSHLATLLMLLPPSTDGLVADLQAPTDLTIVEVFCKQLHRLKAALLQCHKVALYAAWIAHAELDAAGASWFRYITRNSVRLPGPAARAYRSRNWEPLHLREQAPR